MNSKDNLIKLIKNNFGIFLFLIFFVILYREFLHTYKIQLEQTIPYFLYQPQIEYYLTDNDKFI